MNALPPSLGAWLEENARAIGLLKVATLVDPNAYEATAILHQLETPTGGPPVLFEQLSNLAGAGSSARMLFNTYSKRRSVSLALGAETATWNQLLEALPERTAQLRQPTVVGAVPVHDTMLRGAELDLRSLP
jgi:3-polyprenyl-4-hydroxybenzoate decarboxylase